MLNAQMHLPFGCGVRSCMCSSRMLGYTHQGVFKTTCISGSESQKGQRSERNKGDQRITVSHVIIIIIIINEGRVWFSVGICQSLSYDTFCVSHVVSRSTHAIAQ